MKPKALCGSFIPNTLTAQPHAWGSTRAACSALTLLGQEDKHRSMPRLCWVQHRREAKAAPPPWECSVPWVPEAELPMGQALPCTPHWAQPLL